MKRVREADRQSHAFHRFVAVHQHCLFAPARSGAAARTPWAKARSVCEKAWRSRSGLSEGATRASFSSVSPLARCASICASTPAARVSSPGSAGAPPDLALPGNSSAQRSVSPSSLKTLHAPPIARAATSRASRESRRGNSPQVRAGRAAAASRRSGSASGRTEISTLPGCPRSGESRGEHR